MSMVCSLGRVAFCAGVLWFAAGRMSGGSSAELPPLNEPPTADRLAGKFIWADLFTTEPTVAARFYEGLFGWVPTTFSRDGRTYFLLKHDDRPVAGIVQRANDRPDAPKARWVGYIAVNDVARTVTAVAKSGGHVLAPVRDFSRRGTQAIVADNEGAVVGLLHSLSGDPADYQAETGEWIWAELLANQPAAAATFYRNVFGYDATAVATDERQPRFILVAGGFARAGIAPLPEAPDAQPAWLGFVRVEQAAAAAARAIAFGGRVLAEPQLSHLGTRFAIVADPGGAAVAVIEFDGARKPTAGP